MATILAGLLLCSLAIILMLLLHIEDLKHCITTRDNMIDHNKRLTEYQVQGLYKEINRLIKENNKEYEGKHERD